MRHNLLRLTAAFAPVLVVLALAAPAGASGTRELKSLSTTATQTSLTYQFTDANAVGTVTYTYAGACVGKTTGASGVTITVTCSNLTPTTEYDLQVAATDATGVTTTADLFGLTKPDNPVVTEKSATSTSITFNITSNPLYNVYNTSSQVFTYSYADACNGNVAGETGTTVTVTCTNLSPATGYQLNVDATSATGVEQGLTEFVGYTTPAAPVVTQSSSTATSVTWTLTDQAGTENAALTVTYDYSGACSGSVNDHGNGEASVTCTGLTTGKTYTLSVYAVTKLAGTSPTTTASGIPDASGTSTTSPAVAPSVPVLVAKSSTNASATVVFDSTSGSGTITYHYSGSCSGTVAGVAGQKVSVTCNVAKPKSVTIDVLATNTAGSSPYIIAFVAR